MKQNIFSNCAEAIKAIDLVDVEAALGFSLPNAFIQHYLEYNGGNPELCIFPENDRYESIEVVAFYPIKNNTPAFETKNSLLVEHYHWMRQKDVIPESLLPFAHDPGGNFFCLLIPEGSVVFFATDAFDPGLSMADNQIKAQRKLSDTFEAFMNQLKPNEMYEGDEWPE